MVVGIVFPDAEEMIFYCLGDIIGERRVAMRLPRERRSAEEFAANLHRYNLADVILFPAVAEEPGWDQWLHDVYWRMSSQLRRKVRVIGPDMDHRRDWQELPLDQIWPWHMAGLLFDRQFPLQAA